MATCQILDVIDRIVSVKVRILHGVGVKVPTHRSVEGRAAGLRNNLNDTAAHMPVLRFKAAGLDLNFLHKREVDTRAERAISSRPNDQDRRKPGR